MPYTHHEAREWPCPSTLAEAIAALDAGRLYYSSNSGKVYQMRRNGVTRTAKRTGWTIVPYKVGFRDYGHLEGRDDITLGPDEAVHCRRQYVIQPERT